LEPKTKAAHTGLILLNKKPGVTSFEALGEIKRALGTGKIGHTGTLDKFASGLLVVLAGRALKLSPWFSHCDKKYTGKICFGMETDTLDPEGVKTAEAPPPSREDVEKALPQFTGEILQSPPAYSAIHINGKRASALAREGKTPEMKKRPVTVYKLELCSWQPPYAEIFVHCSSGTYIRSLARDIALAAGSRAYLCELTRTQVAGFMLEDAATDGIILQPIDKSVIHALGLPYFEISPDETEKIIHGKPLEAILDGKPLFSQGGALTPQAGDFSAAVFSEDVLIAVVEITAGKWKYGCVL
jgi:tRNA pseudouridine55 synthase